MEGLTAQCASALEAQLVASIQENLGQYLYDNARWLAERLVALSANEPNINLLATCYFHSNQAYRSYHLLKNAGVTSPSARYLLALCCVQLGRLHEARNALKQGVKEVPCGAAGCYLLARVCRMSGDTKEAKEHLLAALRLNPLMWCAFEELCALGGDQEAQEICSMSVASLSDLMQQGELEEDRGQQGGCPDTHHPDSHVHDQNTAHDGRGDAGKQAAASPIGKRPASKQLDSIAAVHPGSRVVRCLSPGRHAHLAFSLMTQRTLEHSTPAHHLDAAGFTSAPDAPGQQTGAGMQGASHPDWLQGGTPAWQHAPASDWATPSFTTPSVPGTATAAGGQQPVTAAAQRQAAVDVPPDWPALMMQPDFPASFLASTPSTSEDTQGQGPHSYMAGLSGPGQLGSEPSSASSMHTQGRQEDELNTPLFRGLHDAPPAPPKKHSLKEDGGFQGFGGHSSSTPSTCTPGSQLSFPPQFSGALPPARAMRLAMEDGKVRKVTGKSLFNDGPAAPGSAAPPTGPGRCSPSRRSSRLAALAGGGSTVPRSPTGPGGVRARGVGAGARGMDRHHQHHQPSHRMRQHQADPGHVHPPPLKHGQPGKDMRLLSPGANKQNQRLMHGVLKPSSRAELMGSLAAAAASHQHHQAHAHVRKTSLGQALFLHLLGPAYEGYRHMCMFRSQEALDALKRLPACQLNTSWARICMGRLLMERMDYHQAAAAFKEAHELDRQCVEGLEYYSTVLWHLKRDTELSYLAQSALAIDRLAPQSWVVVGNLFSLQKEHETALKLFERALQLNPEFTYAYTLSGHEYAASDELDKAQAAYSNALRIDPRHYNALYGLGSVHFRQEHYDVALLHFRKAAAISPRSSVLHCYVGMALARQGLLDKALHKMQEAIDLDPRNPLAHYEKANVLVSQGDLAAALQEFNSLVNLAPGEASVYMQMGKLYKRLGRLRDAQRQLEMALSFATASGDAATIKTAIDKLTMNEDENEEEM